MLSVGQIIEANHFQCPNHVGSPLFQAPEIVNNQQYSTPVDIWSLGCVFFEVMTKQPPCFAQSDQELLNLLKNHINNPNYLYRRIDQFIQNQILQKLIKEMIHPDPQKRVRIDDVQNQLKTLNLPNFNQKFINNFGNFIVQPKPQFNQINFPQEPFQLQQSIKDMATQINQLKEILQTQNNDLGQQIQSLFKNFEEKIENKIDEKMLQISSLKEDANLNLKQFDKSLEQVELNLFSKINDQSNSLQQNLFNQQKIQNDQFEDYCNRKFQDISNQLETRLIKNNEEQQELQNYQNQLIEEQKNTSIQIMKKFEENLNNLQQLKDLTNEQVRVNQSYSSKFEQQQIELQNLKQQIIEITSEEKYCLEQGKLFNQRNIFQQYQEIKQYLEQISKLSQKSFEELQNFQSMALQQIENKINKQDILQIKVIMQDLFQNMFHNKKYEPLSLQKQKARIIEAINQNQFQETNEMRQLSANIQQQQDIETQSRQNIANRDIYNNEMLQIKYQQIKQNKNQILSQGKQQAIVQPQQQTQQNIRPNSGPQKKPIKFGFEELQKILPTKKQRISDTKDFDVLKQQQLF